MIGLGRITAWTVELLLDRLRNWCNSRRGARSCIVIAIVIAACVSSSATAHVPQQATSLAKINRDGSIHIALTFDTLAYVLNDTTERIDDLTMNEFLDASADEQREQLELAKQRLEKSLVISTDTGRAALTNLSFPQVKDLDDWKRRNIEPRLPVMLEVTADASLPRGSHEVKFEFPEILGTMALTVEKPDAETESFGVEPRNSLTMKLPQEVQDSLAIHSIHVRSIALLAAIAVGVLAVATVLLMLIRARARGGSDLRNATP